MKFKFITIFALALITGITGFALWQRNIGSAAKPVSIATEELTAVQKKLSNHIAQHENRVWQELASIGISQERYKKVNEQTYDLYVRETDKAFNKPEGPVAKQTEKLIHGVMQEFGINPADITLVSNNSIMGTANACDKLMLINEKNFSLFSEQAQKFIIAHEIQHILNKDHSTCSVIRNLLPAEQKEQLTLPRMHPLMQFYRFKEERADLGAAMKSNEWAKRYLAYTNEIMEVYGNTDHPTHPKSSDRLKFAQTIVQEITTQIV